MRGMDAKTGKELEGIEHLKQSMINMGRDYGSRLFELVDKPINRDLTLGFLYFCYFY